MIIPYVCVCVCVSKKVEVNAHRVVRIKNTGNSSSTEMESFQSK